jgi:protein involved in polysaccharide export with SLBB domain
MKINNLKREIQFILVFLILCFSSGIALSQSDNYYLSGAKTGAIDTLSYNTTQDLLKHTSGILEKEIDPGKYILGPSDFLTISIISVKPQIIELQILPDGHLIIPGVGSIELKNKTLAEAENLIRDKVTKIIRSTEVNVSLSKLREFKVTVTGAVHKPSIVTATAVDRVSEVIEKSGGLDRASIRRILIIRENIPEPIHIDLLTYFMLHNKEANPTVLGGDQIIIPTLDKYRKIEINGDVTSPDVFEYLDGDSLSTLIKFSQGFLKTAFLDSVEIVRLGASDNSIIKWIVNLSGWNNMSDPRATFKGDFPLMMGDRVYIRHNPYLPKEKFVALGGEITFPGRYAISDNEFRITDLIKKAGGFTKKAYVNGGILIRRSSWGIEDPEMERLGKLKVSDMTENEKKYFKARSIELRGAMSLNFVNIFKHPESEENLTLIDGDSIYIPFQNEFVNIQGKVKNPGLILYKKDYTYMDYINEAGGFGFRADEGNTLVVKSKGEQYLAKDMDYKIEQGDMILVPQKTELTFWDIFTSTLTILTQLVTVAGVIYTIVRLK